MIRKSAKSAKVPNQILINPNEIGDNNEKKEEQKIR